QAEDGIRDFHVTGVQTCALPISGCGSDRPDVLTFSGSALGREGSILRTQLQRFSQLHGIPVEIRSTPDSADQRHQLYVQWLNARSEERRVGKEGRPRGRPWEAKT